jgi:peptidyl-prolyl cis-trans isomerase SurA
MKLENKTIRYSLFLVFFLIISSNSTFAQFVIDQVLSIVGNEKILLSDIEQEELRMKMQGYNPEGDVKCDIFEDLLVQKLLLHQAQIDSISVTNTQVESEMERRLKFFISQVGSEAALESYFNKTIFQIRDDLRKAIREALLTQQMQEKVVSNVTVTPSEVKKFFRNIPNDSLPVIPEQYEYRQILLYPPATSEAKFLVREQLLDLRERILKGERFTTLAVAYSEDRATATRGGELGFRSREELVKSFADAAFNLKEGQVSQIVETEYGFHIIQMIEKRGDQVNVRHILMKPVFSMEMLSQTHNRLDSIANLIKSDSISFIRAAQLFSEDEKTRLSGGLVINAQKGTPLFEKEQLNPSDYYSIRNLSAGDLSAPFESRDEHANIVYKVIKLTRVIPQHIANLDDDYATIQQIAKGQKQQQEFIKWINDKIKKTYIRIDPSYSHCDFEIKGWIK